MRGITASLLVIVLYGCASAEKQPVLLYEAIKKGDRLTIAKPIQLAPVNQTIYFQAGSEHSWLGADVWRTLCRLRIGDGVGSEIVTGSVYEVSSVRRTHDTQADLAEILGVSLTLRTISGSNAEYLSCERWDALSSFNTLSEITLDDFKDAVNGYFKIVDMN